MSAGNTTSFTPDRPLKKARIEVLRPGDYIAALQRAVAHSQAVRIRFTARKDALPVVLTEPSDEAL